MLSYRLTRITINMLLTQHKLPDWHCAKSVVSSLSCSKTMCQFIQWVRTASMSVSSISDFWNGRHPRSFRQAYDSGTQICPQWTTKFAQKFSSVFASKIITWSLTDIMEWLAGIFEQRIISNATDEWCNRLWVRVLEKTYSLSIEYIWTFNVLLVKIKNKLMLLSVV